MEPHWSDEQEEKIKFISLYYRHCMDYCIAELEKCGMPLEDALDELFLASAKKL